jgi:tRNA 2-selenouridine synthase
VIDVRSPAEFAEDHAPGAVNLPVLDDEERARVGYIYVQQSPFLARKVGGALVAHNIARHLEGALADMGKDFKPLVYCWRGGQRSNAMALVLAQVGWRSMVLAGGYKTWRRQVQARLYEQELGLRLVLLDGGTGTGKTAVLQRLAAAGMQTLDLEALAAHRGSLFGALPDRPQPHQKGFETALFMALRKLDPSRPVVVEAESSRIGQLMTPPALWSAMATAPRIELSAPRAERARYLATAYDEITADREALKTTLARLPDRIGRARLAELAGMVDAGDFETFAEALMEAHYDIAYARSGRKDERPKLGTVTLEALTPSALDDAATQVAAIVNHVQSDNVPVPFQRVIR